MSESVMSATDLAWMIEVENTFQRTILLAIAYFGESLGDHFEAQAKAIASRIYATPKAVENNLYKMIARGELRWSDGRAVIQ